MAMTRGAGILMQVLSIPVIAYGFVAIMVMLINSGFQGVSVLIWPGLGYVAAFALGMWMLKSGQRASKRP